MSYFIDLYIMYDLARDTIASPDCFLFLIINIQKYVINSIHEYKYYFRKDKRLVTKLSY